MKKKFKTQNTHKFRFSFILNMNKKKHKPRKNKFTDNNMILT